MVVPPNHPSHFSIENHGDLGYPHLGNFHIAIYDVITVSALYYCRILLFCVLSSTPAPPFPTVSRSGCFQKEPLDRSAEGLFSWPSLGYWTQTRQTDWSFSVEAGIILLTPDPGHVKGFIMTSTPTACSAPATSQSLPEQPGPY